MTERMERLFSMCFFIFNLNCVSYEIKPFGGPHCSVRDHVAKATHRRQGSPRAGYFFISWKYQLYMRLSAGEERRLQWNKKTPLYDIHIAEGGKMVPFAGYLLPVQYEPAL